MTPKKLAAYFREWADSYERHTEWLGLHAPIQTMYQCPGCKNSTRGGAVCPACLRAVADVLVVSTLFRDSNRDKVS